MERRLTGGQLKAAVDRCLYCAERKCNEGCPCGVSPAKFLYAIKENTPSDYRRAAGHILTKNPLGTICGHICSDLHCQKQCSRRQLDGEPIPIPNAQATIMKKARELNVLPVFEAPAFNGKKVAVIGGGAAGLGCTAVLAQQGFEVTVYEQGEVLGGQFMLVPEDRLPQEAIDQDMNFIKSLGPNGHKVHVIVNSRVEKADDLLKQYDYVADCRGAFNPNRASFKADDPCLVPADILTRSKQKEAREIVQGKRVAILGGGATAVDCACHCAKLGASSVTILYRRGNAQMRITDEERNALLKANVDVIPRVSPINLLPKEGSKYYVSGIRLERMRAVAGKPDTYEPVPDSRFDMEDVDVVVCAFGFVPDRTKLGASPNIICCPQKGTVVQSVAAGKECAAQLIKKALKTEEMITDVKGYNEVPISLQTEFMNTCHAPNPFVLAASPVTDGYTICNNALEAGWGGVVVKTAFPHPEEMLKEGKSPIHVPMDYMGYFGSETHGNCDNVSGHALQQTCEAVRRLKAKWGNSRIIAGSTGGTLVNDVCYSERPEMNGGKTTPSKYFVDGCPCARCSWRRNAAMLEDAGADFVEFSLSCPQGGEGGEGSIAGQDPKTTQRIVEWVMSMERPEYATNPSLRKPKIFKMTGAVTSIEKIIGVIADVLKRYGGVGGPKGFGGITLANSFPSAMFGPWHKDGETIDEKGNPTGRRYPWAAVMGMSGHGVRPISTLTLANVQSLGVPTAGNGGIDGWRSAADFLALGVGIVQMCALAEERGLRVIEDLTSGLSSYMEYAGFSSISDLRGAASPAILDFMEISSKKHIPTTLCQHSCIKCHKCEDCPYSAIKVDESGIVRVDPGKCIGCSLCVSRCPGRALGMRDRKPEELVEHQYW